MEFSPETFLGPVAALALAIIGLRTLWNFLVKLIEDKFEIMREELAQCHKQHEETKEQLSFLQGKIEVLEKYNPASIVSDIISGVEQLLKDK